VFGQLSPGDLSRAHADLEGLTNCTQCHEIGQKVIPDKCLSCHTILKDRISKGKGMHADPGFEDCSDCHSEHHGREYKLIYWDGGQENFDHKQTGFELLGKHTSLKCNDCHISKNIKNKKELQEKKKDLNKTFLGLTKDCLSCHRDEHRGQMENSCLNCHGMHAWKPAPHFDHNNTKFRLTGLHNKLECQSCHKTITDNKFEDDKSYLKFAGLKSDNCIDCHIDPHNNRFGRKCESCHNTSGWQNYAKNRFDHSKTNYPLLGKHAFVSCEKCHGASRSKNITQFDDCQDCHSDYHAGQFQHRSDKGKCESCHTVKGFSPANFTIENHKQTGFSLTGAHLAIPCIACHEPTIIKNKKTLRFKFTSMQCESCHKDPHKGQVDKYKKLNNNAGCQYCHVAENWQTVQFDHSLTEFELEGKHKTILCSKCHVAQNQNFIKFSTLSKECASCHKDIHGGQFNENGKQADCAKCHRPIDWFAEKFDHDKHSSFKLQGAHSKVACQNCHKTENVSGTMIVRYKPLDSECKACHGDNRKYKTGQN
jgi:hypothetical protein